MVRAGIVDHPSQWLFCGYNEIQNPRRKNVLINYDKLRELVGVETYDQVKQYHKGWVEEYLGDGNNRRDEKWTKSIAACRARPVGLIDRTGVKCCTSFNWGG